MMRVVGHLDRLLYAAPFLLTTAVAGSVRADARAETKHSVSASPVGRPFVLLPKAVASFGAAVCGDWLYAYGGHVGKKHEHSIDNLSGSFWRLNLLDGRTWEALPDSTPLQSVALVCHDNKLYRVGGMSARNVQGEEEDMYSVAEFARYEPLSRTWTPLPPLPEARSSHDAIVLAGKLYVVGGWKLAGASADATWHETAYAFDLDDDDARWTEMAEQPFTRRALAVAAAGGKLYAIGGLPPDGQASPKVDVYDRESNEWSEGAALPSNGFGVSAIGVGDAAYVSGRDGNVYRFEEGDSGWQRAGRWTFGRIFHRMVAWEEELLALGGAAKGGHIRQVERLAPAEAPERPRIVHWTTPFPGRAKNRSGLFLFRNALYVFGGNNSLAQHDFAPENFVSEGYRIHLGSLHIDPLAELPVPRQSMRTLVTSHSLEAGYAVGGFGHNGTHSVTQDEVLVYDFFSDAWERAAVKLPESRTQFGLVEWERSLWVFGGLHFDPTKGGEARFDHRTQVLEWPIGSDAKTFTQSAYELPRPRRAFGGALLGERYYLVGGMRGGFELVEPCDVFNFSTRSWETIPSPAKPRISPELVALNGKLYLAGGFSPRRAGGREANSTIEVFDPQSDTWSELTSELPISAKHMHMHAYGDALLLFSTYEQEASAAHIVLIHP